MSLNIPLFLGMDDQMSAEDVIETQEIASLRIPVERAINRVKNFQIFDGAYWSSESNVVHVCHVVQYAELPYQCLKDHSPTFVLLTFETSFQSVQTKEIASNCNMSLGDKLND